MNQRAFKNEAELRREGFIIQKYLHVWTVVTVRDCDSDIK
jgi:hypothetical protein